MTVDETKRKELSVISTDELLYACSERAARLILYRDKVFNELMAEPKETDKEFYDLVNAYNKVTITLKEYDNLFQYKEHWLRRIWNLLHKEGTQIGSNDFVDENKAPALTDPSFSSEERLKEWVTTAEEIKTAE